MEKLREIIAENLTALRKNARITQAELAEKLNYSDKAVSKWERAEAIPDVTVLYELAELYSVTVDYFLHRHSESEKLPTAKKKNKGLHIAIALTSCISPYFIAAIVFLTLSMTLGSAEWLWKIFVCPLPIIAILSLVFISVWFKSRTAIFTSISALIWSIILTVYVFIMHIPSAAIIFTIGIPLQIIIVVWSLLFKKNNKKHSEV